MAEQTNQIMEAQDIATGVDTNTTELPDSLFGDDSFESDTTISNEAETDVEN